MSRVAADNIDILASIQYQPLVSSLYHNKSASKQPRVADIYTINIIFFIYIYIDIFTFTTIF